MGWIWHQKFYAGKATYVGSYYNITNDPESEKLFKSSFDGTGPFERNNKTKPKKIGFKNAPDKNI